MTRIASLNSISKNVNFIINPMKKVLLFIFISLFFSLTVGQVRAQEEDLRDLVAVVYPMNDANSIVFLKEFGPQAIKYHNDNYYNWLERYTKSRFSTGFVYQDSLTKQMFLITNKWVVSLVKSVRVEFLGSNQSVVKYESCPVVAINDKLDLTLIALPDSVQRPSLSFSQQEVKDGDIVFSASYPAFGKTPSWQFAKGIISNAQFYSPLLTDYEDIPLLQHTVQLDAGSFGSPLLIQERGTEGNFAVVGINILKAYNRENVNLALPAQHIIDFVNEYIHSKTELSNDPLLVRANQFVKALDDYKKIIPFISDEYMFEMAPTEFQKWYKLCSKEVQDEIIKKFNGSDPIEGVRIAMAYALYKKVAKKTLKVVNEAMDEVTVNMLYENQRVTSEWVEEKGELRLKTLSFFKPHKVLDCGIDWRFAYGGFALGASGAFNPVFNLTSKYSLMYNLSFSAASGPLTFDFIFKYGSLPHTRIKQHPIIFYNDTVFAPLRNAYGIDMSFGFQLPIQLGSIYIIPNVKPFAGVIFKKENCLILNYGLRSGIETGFRVKKENYLFLGIAHKLTGFKNMRIEDDDEIFGLHSLDIYIKYTL